MKRTYLPFLKFAFALFLLAVALGTKASTTYAVGGVVIDEFEEIADAQILNATLATSPQQSTLDHASILGGERDAQVVVTAGAGTMTTNTSDPGGFLDHPQPVGLRGRTILTWDGNDNNAAVLNATGLGGVNLVAPANNAFLVAVVSADLTSQMQISVYTNAANYSTAIINIPAGTSQTTFLIPFSSFVITAGTGANFTSVGAIQMTINNAATPTAALDIVLDFFTAGESGNFMDLGDLPNSYGTTIAANGPRHSTSNVFLGTVIDNESDGTPTGTATGDDTGDGSDDDDGITLSGDWYSGASGGRFNIFLNGSDSSACVSGWMDFNNDGDFADPGEQILDTILLPSSGSNTIPFSIPAGIFPPTTATVLTLNTRIRVIKDAFGDAFCAPGSEGGDEQDVASTGAYANGEVEDHQFFISDYGDLPATYNNTTNSDNGAYHTIGNLYLGATVDMEVEGKESASSQGDDTTDTVDDEDGIVYTPLVWGLGTGEINATVAGGPGCLVGWADYNGDGDFADEINDGVGTVSERLFSQSLASGTTVVSFATPRSSLGSGTFVYPGLINMRFRLFPLNAPLFTSAGLALTGGCPNGTNTTAQMAVITRGAAARGEVEDYQHVFTPTAITLQSLELALPTGTTMLPGIFALLTITGMVLWRRRFNV